MDRRGFVSSGMATGLAGFAGAGRPSDSTRTDTRMGHGKDHGRRDHTAQLQ